MANTESPTHVKIRTLIAKTIEKSHPMDTLVSMVDEMLHVESDELDVALLSINKVFSKLYNLYASESKVLSNLMHLQSVAKHTRWKRYSGKLPASHYAEEPLPETVLKTDVGKYLEQDDVMSIINFEVGAQSVKVKFLEDAIKRNSNRSYDIKAAIEWRRLMQGS